MAVQAMYALKPTPCFLGGSFMSRGENGVFMIVTVKVYRFTAETRRKIILQPLCASAVKRFSGIRNAA